jgi:hypothetical protein
MVSVSLFNAKIEFRRNLHNSFYGMETPFDHTGMKALETLVVSATLFRCYDLVFLSFVRPCQEDFDAVAEYSYSFAETPSWGSSAQLVGCSVVVVG